MPESYVPSFDISYDADDDVLEVCFEVFDDSQARALQLNDNIVVFANRSLTRVWAITLYAYRTLLSVGETVFTGLGDLPEAEAEATVEMLCTGPVTGFLDFFDREESVARVLTPHLRALLEDV
jgi:hypothetical protein